MKLPGLHPGEYTLVFSFLGYETLEIPNVVVESGKVTQINTALGAGSVSLDEVVITVSTSKDSEIALLLDQKKALVIQEAISAEALKLKGIDNAAAAVAQIFGNLKATRFKQCLCKRSWRQIPKHDHERTFIAFK